MTAVHLHEYAYVCVCVRGRCWCTAFERGGEIKGVSRHVKGMLAVLYCVSCQSSGGATS